MLEERYLEKLNEKKDWLERQLAKAISNGDRPLQSYCVSRLHQVDHAMRRCDEGTYGRCEVCGKTIYSARLDLCPSATKCRDCAESSVYDEPEPLVERVSAECL